MKITIQEIPITDLVGNDIRKAIIKDNGLSPNFIEKHLGNFIYTQGSNDVYELGRQIYQGESIEVFQDQIEELKKLVQDAFNTFPPIVARAITQYIK